jgi:hypothetical protein
LPLSRKPPHIQAVTSILDLFPSESPAFLRACLLHPRFSSSSGSTGQDLNIERAQEQVVEALLSDGSSSFPDELTRIRLGLVDDGDGGGVAAGSAEADVAAVMITAAPSSVAEAPVPAAVIERRNVYDDDKYFQRGKILLPSARGSSDSAPAARIRHRVVELDERLKQSILALAERESSDDEEEDDQDHLESGEGGGVARRRKTYGFLEEEEDGDDGTATPRIRIGGADEEPDENEQEAEVGDGEGGGSGSGSRDRPLAQSRVSDVFFPFSFCVLSRSLSRQLGDICSPRPALSLSFAPPLSVTDPSGTRSACPILNIISRPPPLARPPLPSRQATTPRRSSSSNRPTSATRLCLRAMRRRGGARRGRS